MDIFSLKKTEVTYKRSIGINNAPVTGKIMIFFIKGFAIDSIKK